MEFFGIAITILAVVITYLAWRNGRWMKQSHQDTVDLIKQLHQNAMDWMRQTHGDVVALLDRIEKGQNETRKEVVEARKEMAESIRYLAQLIVSESEKTRQEIKARS